MPKTGKTAVSELAEQVREIEAGSGAVLAPRLAQSETNVQALRLRIKYAEDARDPKRLKELEALLTRAEREAQFYRKRLTEQFPDFAYTAPDARAIERAVIIEDYLLLLRLRQEAKLTYEAAAFTENQTEKDMAQQDVNRITRYLALLKPKFKKYEREMAKE